MKKIQLDINLIIEEYNNGKTAQEIANILKVSKRTILDRLKELNVKTRPSGRRKIIRIKKQFHGNWKGYEEITGDFWNKIQNSAKVRNLLFNITIQDVWELYIKQNRKCALSGVDIFFFKGYANRSKITASLDRIDSSKGYTKDNVQWVHKTVNNIKMNLDETVFIDWCKKIANYKNDLT